MIYLTKDHKMLMSRKLIFLTKLDNRFVKTFCKTVAAMYNIHGIHIVEHEDMDYSSLYANTNMMPEGDMIRVQSVAFGFKLGLRTLAGL